MLDVIDSPSDPSDRMSEGRPHKEAKSRAIDLLGLHFKALGVLASDDPVALQRWFLRALTATTAADAIDG